MARTKMRARILATGVAGVTGVAAKSTSRAVRDAVLIDPRFRSVTRSVRRRPTLLTVDEVTLSGCNPQFCILVGDASWTCSMEDWIQPGAPGFRLSEDGAIFTGKAVMWCTRGSRKFAKISDDDVQALRKRVEFFDAATCQAMLDEQRLSR